MGRLIVSPGTKIYLDAVTIIYTVESSESFQELRSLWQWVSSGDVFVFTSELTLLEVLVQPLRNGNADLVSLYENLLLETELRLMPVTQPILRAAAELRSHANLKTPDAIHVATALEAGCDVLLTNDRDLSRVSGLEVVLLGEIDGVELGGHDAV